MSISIFEDLGKKPTSDLLKRVVSDQYLSEDDEALIDMTPGGWILVLAGNIMEEDPEGLLVMENQGTSIPWVLESLKAIIDIIDKHHNFWRPNNAGYSPVHQLAQYCIDNLDFHFSPIFKYLKLGSTENNPLYSYQNEGSVTPLHILASDKMDTQLAKLYNAEPRIVTLSHTDEFRRDSGKAINQPTVTYLALKKLANASTDEELNNAEDLMSSILDLFLFEENAKKSSGGNSTVAPSFPYGPGVRDYKLSVNLNNDDMSRFILAEAHSVIIELFTNERKRTSAFSLLDPLVIIREEKEVFINKFNEALIEKFEEKSNDEKEDKVSLFPTPSEDFLKEDLAKHSDKFQSMITVPFFSYYLAKYAESSNVYVMDEMFKVTTGIRFAMGDKVYPFTPMSMVATLIEIGDDGTLVKEGVSGKAIEIFSSYSGAIVSSSARELYIKSMDGTRLSQMREVNYIGGISLVLKKICQSFNNDRDEERLTQNIMSVLPGSVTVAAVIKWGEEYGVVRVKLNDEEE